MNEILRYNEKWKATKSVVNDLYRKYRKQYRQFNRLDTLSKAYPPALITRATLEFAPLMLEDRYKEALKVAAEIEDAWILWYYKGLKDD